MPAATASRATVRPAVGALRGNGVFGLLLNMLVAEKSGFQLVDQPGGTDLHEFTEKIAKQAMENIEEAMKANVGSVANGNVDLNLEVSDPSKTVASGPRPQPVEAARTTASKS